MRGLYSRSSLFVFAALFIFGAVCAVLVKAWIGAAFLTVMAVVAVALGRSR